MEATFIRGGVQGGRWDGLQGERDRAGRRREARAPAAGAVREVVDGRETSHATESETLRWLTSSQCRPRGQDLTKRREKPVTKQVT